METYNGLPTFYATRAVEWRKWLRKNGKKAKALWLIIYHQNSETPSVKYAESIEHALCFGWIDSKAVKRDAESFYLYFTPRKVTSRWSKINRERVERMTALGLMEAEGQALIDLAKENGTWELQVPSQLQALLKKNKTAAKNFEAFSNSSKLLLSEWILNAKKPETIEKRVSQAVEIAYHNIRTFVSPGAALKSIVHK